MQVQELSGGSKYVTLALTPNDLLGELDILVPTALDFEMLQVLIPQRGTFPQGTKQELYMNYGPAWTLQVQRLVGKNCHPPHREN